MSLLSQLVAARQRDVLQEGTLDGILVDPFTRSISLVTLSVDHVVGSAGSAVRANAGEVAEMLGAWEMGRMTGLPGESRDCMSWVKPRGPGTDTAPAVPTLVASCLCTTNVYIPSFKINGYCIRGRALIFK